MDDAYGARALSLVMPVVSSRSATGTASVLAAITLVVGEAEQHIAGDVPGVWAQR